MQSHIRIIRCFYQGVPDSYAYLNSISHLIVYAFKEYHRTLNKSRMQLTRFSTATAEAGTAR